MSGRKLRRLGLGVALAIGVFGAPLRSTERVLVAQEPPQPQGAVLNVPIRVVNGHLIVLTDLVGLRYTNEASFEISLEYPDALTLHPDQYQWLGLNPNDTGLGGDGPMIRLLIAGGVRLSIPAAEVVPESSADRVAFQNSMTKLYSKELGERKLKGTIGIGLLRKYFVSLDVAGKRMILAPPRQPSPQPNAAISDTVDLTAPFEYVNNRVQMNMSVGDDRRAILAVGGTNYDTFIDTRVVKTMGKAAGNVSPVWLSDSGASGRRVDLSQYLAFRPKPFGLSETPGADSPLVMTGVNFLENFQVDLDFANQKIGLTQRKSPVYPKVDFLFFEAESRGTAEAVEAYLQAYPDSRLGPDAADLLIRKRLEQDSPDADVIKAMGWAVRTTPADRRIETCAKYVDVFDQLPNRTTLAIAAGEEGLKYSREAFDGRAVYALHHRIGQLEMKRQNWDEAWKHLLSAAFMAPDDLNLILDLARVYDKQGEVRRAYARYKRLSVAPGAPPEIAAEIKAAMDRLRPRLPKDDPLLRDETPTGRGRGRGVGRNQQ